VVGFFSRFVLLQISAEPAGAKNFEICEHLAKLQAWNWSVSLTRFLSPLVLQDNLGINGTGVLWLGCPSCHLVCSVNVKALKELKH